MDYYLGRTNSCQGGAGGPLWQYIGNIIFITIRYLEKKIKNFEMKLFLFYNSFYLINT